MQVTLSTQVFLRCSEKVFYTDLQMLYESFLRFLFAIWPKFFFYCLNETK